MDFKNFCEQNPCDEVLHTKPSLSMLEERLKVLWDDFEKIVIFSIKFFCEENYKNIKICSLYLLKIIGALPGLALLLAYIYFLIVYYPFQLLFLILLGISFYLTQKSGMKNEFTECSSIILQCLLVTSLFFFLDLITVSHAFFILFVSLFSIFIANIYYYEKSSFFRKRVL
jgi:hypothetical protein